MGNVYLDSISDTTISVSLEAVPFPIAITSISNLLIKSAISFCDSSTSFRGSLGYITPCSKNLPVSSKTANLHPVLKLGSMARILISLTGGTINKFLVFLPNTFIASSSALSVSMVLISLSMEGAISLL